LEISPEPGQEVLTGRWTATESWKRLEEILRAPVQLHADSNALPARSVVSLQTALEEWEVTPLRALFTAKVRELDALQVRLHLSVVPLAGQYREVLAAHLIAPDRSRTDPGPRSAPAFSLRALNRDTARHLNLLDTRRTQLASTALQMSENAKPPGAAVVAKPERE
jgi:hypothetical protein